MKNTLRLLVKFTLSIALLGAQEASAQLSSSVRRNRSAEVPDMPIQEAGGYVLGGVGSLQYGTP